MKKVLAVLLATTVCSFSSAEFSYRFYNKLSSDVITIRHVDRDYLGSNLDFKSDKHHSYTDADFLGVQNKVYAEIKTDKTDAMVKATIGFKDQNDDNDYGFKWDGYVDDWYVEYRPWNFITLGFHDSIYMNGSYLPIYDDNLYSGNIGSEGFTFVYSPSVLNGALRIAATAPFTAKTDWLYADKDDDDKTPVDDDTFDMGIGAIYSVEYFEVGATFQDIFDNDERRFGVYLDFPTLFGLAKEISVGGGYAHSEGNSVYDFDGSNTWDDYTEFGGVNGENLFSAYFTYSGKVGVDGEIVWNFNDKDYQGINYIGSGSPRSYGGWDLYTALSAKFGVAGTPFSVTFIGKLLADTAHYSGQHLKNVYAGEFDLDYQLSKHSELEAAVAIDYFDNNWNVRFPCYWKYTF